MAVGCAFLVGLLTIVCTLTGGIGAPTTGSWVDVRPAAQNLVHEIRRFVYRAREGEYVQNLYHDALDLEVKATALLGQIPGEVSEYQTNLVIKMAAAETGSHEVLTLLLAEDALSVMNGRLALSLAFLEHLAGQLEDELSLSSDPGAQLTAVAFGASITAKVSRAAENIVKAAALPQLSKNNNNNNSNGNNGNNTVHKRVRRQLNQKSSYSLLNGLGFGNDLLPSLSPELSPDSFKQLLHHPKSLLQLPVFRWRGFTFGPPDWVKWESKNGKYTFRLKPTFHGGVLPSGFKLTFDF
ncbi:uncharacterized protein LOC143276555 [Babylonia areolata]|uniref:uncharacterized protein LOC143276555 n=1 Tax=Babylonia areolata TaxID=304850 RepID=UPI003FCFFC6B